MLTSLVSNTLKNIEIIEKMVSVHQEVITSSTLRERVLIKDYAVSSCVTKLYAIYENFVRDALSDYLDSLSEKVRFSNLQDDFKKQYRIGISRILSRIEHNQYKDLTHENVIKWYHEALKDNKKYKFVNKALISHDQNLRLVIIERIFSHISLKDFNKWLDGCVVIEALYEDKESISEQLSFELNNFVQLRNDASHGIVDNLISEDGLIRLCTLIKAFITSISIFLNKEIFQISISQGKATKLGVISEVLENAGANILQIQKDISIDIHTVYYFLNKGRYNVYAINSLQVDGNSRERITSSSDEFEVGIKTPLLLKKNTKVYVLNQ